MKEQLGVDGDLKDGQKINVDLTEEEYKIAH